METVSVQWKTDIEQWKTDTEQWKTVIKQWKINFYTMEIGNLY